MTTDDLFPIRALVCHGELFAQLQTIENDETRQLGLLAFTSNLANCSKLVPPITSRGPMSAGAWMTGFYVGSRYIENNVFHFFPRNVF